MVEKFRERVSSPRDALSLILLLLVIIVIVQNRAGTEIHFLFAKIKLPLAVWIFLAALFGYVAARLGFRPRRKRTPTEAQ